MKLISLATRDSTKVLLSTCAALVSALPLASASAATADGTLGATSTGTVDINASVPNRAKISGLSTVNFTGQDPALPASNAQNVCVWSNTATKSYSITATGSGAGSAFTLTNGAGTVPYSVEWAASSGAMSGTALSSGSASGALTSAATNLNCASGPTSSASLIIKISTADLGTMSGGSTYSGTLTLLVTPL